MKLVSLTPGGRRIVVSRPDGSTRGRLGVDIAVAFARARAEGTAACLLPPAGAACDALLALTPEDVPLVPPAGLTGALAWGRWALAESLDTVASRRRGAAAIFWREWQKELRRHAGDERLPIDLRGRLRGAAQRSAARSAAAARAADAVRFPRALLRERVRVRLPGELQARAAGAAAAFDTGRPFVAFDVSVRPPVMAAALDLLASRGRGIVHLGQAPLVDVMALLHCEFLVCDSADTQRLAYATNTPCLTVNGSDAFAFYPVRDDGVYLLKRAVDLDTGRTLRSTELLEEHFYRNLRNIGFRDNTGDEIAAAVAEMLQGAGGWRDSDSQIRFRARVVEAGAALAPTLRHAAKWGPVDGFIGDGRLARVQADAAA